MRRQKVWVYVGPREIPENVRRALKERLERHAARKWKGLYREIIVRFRRNFAYVDVLEAVADMKGEKHRESEAIPTHLCRMRYLGDINKWEFAFYKYSDERYEPCYLPSGSFTGTPEMCFDCAAVVYLRG